MFDPRCGMADAATQAPRSGLISSGKIKTRAGEAPGGFIGIERIRDSLSRHSHRLSRRDLPSRGRMRRSRRTRPVRQERMIRAREFEQYRALVPYLSKRQRVRLAVLLQQADEHAQTIELLGKAAATHVNCPRAHPRNSPHGHAHDLQHFRCSECTKTHTSHTGSPMAWLHYKFMWFDYPDCLFSSYTIRRAAERCEIHNNTGCRWRHRIR
jgi:transposase-like protein